MWSTQQNRVGCEISQAAKFCSMQRESEHCRDFVVLQKFATLQNLCNAHSPSAFSSNFLLLCTCSFEFNSGSSHLNWLEDNGIIGLQNYKKYPQNMISTIVGTLVYQLGYLS